MKSSRCLFSSATALRGVFIQPAELSRAPLQLPPQTLHRASRPVAIQARSYATKGPPVKSRLPQNGEIRAQAIDVVDTNNEIHYNQSTRAVLRELDLRTHILVTIREPDDGGLPLCKVISKQAIKEAYRAKQAAPKAVKMKVKTIELNWAIDENDLAHRLDKIKEFLKNGWKVDVMFDKKRKGKAASLEQCEEVLERVRTLVVDVPGVKEWKPMEGKLEKQLVVFLQGTVQKGVVEEKAMTDKQARHAEKMAKKEARRAAREAGGTGEGVEDGAENDAEDDAGGKAERP